jgi:RNA polymerase sigma factor (sigma-70 family)
MAKHAPQAPTADQIALFDSPEAQAVIERIARLCAKKHGQAMNGLDIDDYRQMAAMGLLDACKRFRESVGKPFRNYAFQRVYGFVRDAMRTADEVGRSPRMRGAVGPTVRLDDEVCGSDLDRFLVLKDTLAAKPTPNRTANCEELDRALCNLSLAQRAVAFLTYGVGYTLRDVGHILGIDPAHAGELHESATVAMRTMRSRLF